MMRRFCCSRGFPGPRWLFAELARYMPTSAAWLSGLPLILDPTATPAARVPSRTVPEGASIHDAGTSRTRLQPPRAYCAVPAQRWERSLCPWQRFSVRQKNRRIRGGRAGPKSISIYIQQPVVAVRIGPSHARRLPAINKLAVFCDFFNVTLCQTRKTPRPGQNKARRNTCSDNAHAVGSNSATTGLILVTNSDFRTPYERYSVVKRTPVTNDTQVGNELCQRRGIKETAPIGYHLRLRAGEEGGEEEGFVV